MDLKVYCQICGEFIGKTNTFALAYPMQGSMFTSPDPEHGIPAPFHESFEWADFRCPYGRIHRPSVSDTEIVTEAGTLVLSKSGDPHVIRATRPLERDSIIDRSESVSDEVAEAIIRAEMNNVKAEERTRDKEDEKPLESQEEVEEAGSDGQGAEPVRAGSNDESLCQCEQCGRVFKSRAGLSSHLKAAHKD